MTTIQLGNNLYIEKGTRKHHGVVAQPGNALALRAGFRKDIPVQIRATPFSLFIFQAYFTIIWPGCFARFELGY